MMFWKRNVPKRKHFSRAWLNELKSESLEPRTLPFGKGSFVAEKRPKVKKYLLLADVKTEQKGKINKFPTLSS